MTDAHCGQNGTLFDDFNAFRMLQRPLLFRVVNVHVPGIIAMRPVVIDNQSVKRMTRLHRFPPRPAVYQGYNAHVFVKASAEQGSVKAGGIRQRFKRLKRAADKAQRHGGQRGKALHESDAGTVRQALYRELMALRVRQRRHPFGRGKAHYVVPASGQGIPQRQGFAVFLCQRALRCAEQRFRLLEQTGVCGF